MEKRIKNPYVEMDSGSEYNCFGCSPNNKIGLNLQFVEKGELLTAQFFPTKDYEGYFDILHGGIQATLHDEIGSWMVYTRCERAGVTIGLEVKYRNPAKIDGRPLTINARLVEQNRRVAIMETEIVDADGKVCSTAKVTYRLFSEEVSKEQLNYPGKEAFYE